MDLRENGRIVPHKRRDISSDKKRPPSSKTELNSSAIKLMLGKAAEETEIPACRSIRDYENGKFRSRIESEPLDIVLINKVLN